MYVFIEPVEYKHSMQKAIAFCERNKGVFQMYHQDTELTPRIADHMKLLSNITEPNLARVHCFGYIYRASDIVKKNAQEAFGVEVPEPSEEDLMLLKDRIQATKFDMLAIQDILFSTPLAFSYEHMWDLASVIIQHKHTSYQECALAFMMGNHPRLGESFPMAALDAATLRVITNWSLL